MLSNISSPTTFKMASKNLICWMPRRWNRIFFIFVNLPFTFLCCWPCSFKDDGTASSEMWEKGTDTNLLPGSTRCRWSRQGFLFFPSCYWYDEIDCSALLTHCCWKDLLFERSILKINHFSLHFLFKGLRSAIFNTSLSFMVK